MRVKWLVRQWRRILRVSLEASKTARLYLSPSASDLSTKVSTTAARLLHASLNDLTMQTSLSFEQYCSLCAQSRNPNAPPLPPLLAVIKDYSKNWGLVIIIYNPVLQNVVLWQRVSTRCDIDLINYYLSIKLSNCELLVAVHCGLLFVSVGRWLSTARC